ncbi:unnamed protein product [Darwinula stevensoni]|uniref:Uncharacterized protein n=1 Tax=Darwinula stevensoni TaxID=69355 RepID=A0A7R9A5W2_9CRUS|nr:unnamed protein product [Darwinula stevensoni]CAG0886139.1 unnamed protein product [Darwinula stevensoni]
MINNVRSDLLRAMVCSVIASIRIMHQDGYQDMNYTNLFHHILSHESPRKLSVKRVTLNLKPKASAVVLGEYPTLITSDLNGHYHGKYKCIDGRGQGCVAMTAAAYVEIQKLANFVVLISDEDIKKIFTQALGFLKATTRTALLELLQIYHPRDYRGCENEQVMCVGVEDSWVVEAISRAIRTLIIVDGGNSPTAKSRIELWKEMERRGLLVHRTLPNPKILESLSLYDWREFLNKERHFLKIPRGSMIEEHQEGENTLRAGNQRIFAMGRNKNLLPGYWEIHPSTTLWVRDQHRINDVFLAHTEKLIHGTWKNIHILHLHEEEHVTAPFGWDETLPVRNGFLIDGTAGAAIDDSLFLVGGKSNSEEVLQLNLETEKWCELPNMKEKRTRAALVMKDPHTILVLGGQDPQTRNYLSSCECLDIRMLKPLKFPDLPYSLSDHAVTVSHQYIYISGGWDGQQSLGQVHRMKVNEVGPWETLPSFKIARFNHGMVEDSAGKLLAIGGRYKRPEQRDSIYVQETEKFTEDGWKSDGELPLIRVRLDCQNCQTIRSQLNPLEWFNGVEFQRFPLSVADLVRKMEHQLARYSLSLQGLPNRL